MVLKGIYIGGDWQKSPQDMEVVNPYNGETITSVPCADGTHATNVTCTPVSLERGSSFVRLMRAASSLVDILLDRLDHLVGTINCWLRKEDLRYDPGQSSSQ